MLTLRQRTIISAAHLRGGDTLTELARLTKLPSHLIHYQLHRLRERGIVTRGALIDFYRLGLVEYQLFFSLPSASQMKHQAVLTQLAGSPQVVFSAQLAGDHQFMAVIIARRPAQVEQFTDEIEAKVGAPLIGKRVTTVTAFTLFNPKLLDPAPRLMTSCTVGDRDAAETIDHDDRRILAELWEFGDSSHRDLGAKLGLPRSTIHARIQRLEKRRLIACYGYFLNPTAAGLLLYRLYLDAAAPRRELVSQLLEFCHRHPHVAHIYSTIGSFDFEIGIQVEHPGEAAAAVQDIYRQFGGAIGAIRMSAVLQSMRGAMTLNKNEMV